MRIACNKNTWAKKQKVLFFLSRIFVALLSYFPCQNNKKTESSKHNILLLFSFVIIVTSGCLGNPDREEDECEKRTTFIIDEIREGKLSISDESALPEKFRLKLKACIRAYEKIETKLPHTFWAISRNKKKLKSHTREDFKDDKIVKISTTLSTNENKVIKTNTDGTGCISWEEEYNYAHNNQSEWIILERHIRGISSQRPGVCTIPLAVNPWLQLKEQYKDIQVADYRDRYKKNDTIINKHIKKDVDGLNYLKRKKAEEQKNKVDIIIDPLQLNRDDSISTKLPHKVHQNTLIANLIYKVKDIHGTLQDQLVTKGEFEIEPILLINERTAIDNNDKEATTFDNDDYFNNIGVKEEFITVNTNKRVPIQTEFSGQKLTSNTFQWITPIERYHSPMKIYVKVTPLGETAQRINPFEGIYPIGDSLSKLLGNTILNMPINNILRAKYDNKILGKYENIFPEDANPDRFALNDCLQKLRENQGVYTCLNLDENLMQSLRGKTPSGWLVGDLNIRFFDMKRENWLFREISSLVETKIYNNSPRDIDDEEIIIEVLDLSSGFVQKIKKTTEDGDISFNIKTQQQWYKKQRYFLKLIRFYTKTKELLSEKMIAINPWDYGFTHGYEVDNADEIRTTCLEDKDAEGWIKRVLKNDEINIKCEGVTNTIGCRSQRDTMYRIFCHDPEETPYSIPKPRTYSDTTYSYLSLDKVFNLFLKTLDKLFKLSSVEDDSIRSATRSDKFHEKFTSTSGVPIPEVYIHLFRSINVYPTPLIDSSLTREVYYNIRFKLTPRVVRHDDVPRGQQNKGPLRDGVYIFQMAVLANDQGRVNGRGAMVKSLQQFHPNAYINTDMAGTRSLFSCPIEQPNCVELEDYIIPPQNIPIVVRDGMVKVDIPLHIRSEDLLFADSKNTLVFKILPADPKSIICRKGEPLDCTLDMADSKVIYASAFDWKKTIQNIRPANENDYDMFFHTYKTPFIPAAWGNWNITHELSESFEDIAKQHKYLQANEIFNDLLAGWKERYSYSETEYTKAKVDPDLVLEEEPSPLTGHGFYSIEINKQLNKYHELKAQNTENTTEAINTIQITAEQLVETLKHSRTAVEQNGKLTEEQKALAFERIDKMLKEAQEAQSLISSIVSPETTELPEESHTEVDPDTMPVNQVPNTHTHSACIDRKAIADRLASDRERNEDSDTPTQNDPHTDNCLKNPEQTGEVDLSDKHISYFASQNALCTISINSDQQWSKSCGRFESAAQAQQSFLKTLNDQIDIINETKKQLKNQETEACVRQKMRHIHNNNIQDLKKYAESECAINENSIKDAYKYSAQSSQYFHNKLTRMPELPYVNATNLEQIIQSKWNEDIIINDLVTGSFLHALCGFWFSGFYSKEYINEKLLLDGFRQTVKKSLYYQLKGIDPDFLEDTSLPKDPETREVVKEIRAGFVKMKAHYNEELKSQRLSGEIDELHKWVNNSENYGFDSSFYKELEKKFYDISNAEPLIHHTPSWERRLSLKQWVENLLSDTEETEDTDNYFYLSHYLKEAVEILKQQNSGNWVRIVQEDKTDYHPVRKCMMNPTHFFGIEKKTIVGELDDILEYGYESGEGGVVTKLNISEDFLMNTQRDQGGNQQFEAGITMGFELLALPLLAIPIVGGVGGILAGASGLFGNVLRFFASSRAMEAAKNISTPAALSVLAFKGLTPSTNYSYRGYEGTGKRKLLSIRVSEGVELISEHTPITIRLKKSQECLVIKPRFSAFQNEPSENYKHIWNTENRAIKSIYQIMGILLCTPGDKTSITEDYYYIFPNNNMNGITMDPRHPSNKPFTISLRGKREYHKFKSNLNCYATKSTEHERTKTECRDTRGDYEYLMSKYIEFADDLKEGFIIPKMFHLTGDTPGVHTVYQAGTDRNIKEDQHFLESRFNLMNDWDLFEADVEAIVKREPKR